MTVRKILIAIGVLIFSIILWKTFTRNFEYYNERAQLGWSEEARVKPYLAAKKLLERFDVQVSMKARFDQSVDLNSVDTIFIPEQRYIPHASQQQRLLSWVREGGHLYIGATYVDDEGILEELGIDVEYHYDDEEGEPDVDVSAEENASDEEELSLADMLRKQNEAIREKAEENLDENDNDSENEVVCAAPPYECIKFDIDFDNDGRKLILDQEELYFSGYSDYAISLVNNENTKELEGINFLTLPVGNGEVSVFSSMEIFENRNLAYFDHGYILYKFVDHSRNLIFVHGWQSPTLFELLSKYFLFTLLALAVLGIAFLRHISKRFGPVFSNETTARRALGEKIQAQSQFYWRLKNGSALVGDLREEIHDLARRVINGYEDMTIEKKIRVLSDRTLVNPEQIKAALIEEITFNEERFVDVMSTLQELRKNL